MEECIICMNETIHFTFFPCAHKVCDVCFPKLRKICPLCQTPFYEIVEINIHEIAESITYRDPRPELGCLQASCCILVIAMGMYSLFMFR
jgi:hypothetical protein